MATPPQTKNHNSHSVNPNTKQLALNYRKSIISELFNKIARHSSFDKITSQHPAKESTISKTSTHSKSKSTVQKVNHLTVNSSNHFMNKSSLNQSFSVSNTPSVSNKKGHLRSTSNVKEKYKKPAEMLNQSQHLPDPSGSYSSLAKPIKKMGSNASVGKDCSAVVANSELDMSNIDFDNSRGGPKHDLADSDEVQTGEVKRTGASICKSNKCKTSFDSLQSEYEKKLREITRKYQLQDAMSRQEITNLKQSNSAMQAQIKTLETEVNTYKKRRDKDLEYITSLEKENQKLKQKEKQREKDLAKEGSSTEGLQANENPAHSKQSEYDKENGPSKKIDALNQKIESLSSEKQMLETMLKNLLLSLEKSKFKKPQSQLGSSSPSKRDNTSNALQPKNTNLSENANEATSLQLTELTEKENLHTESCIDTACDQQLTSLKKVAALDLQLDEEPALTKKKLEVSAVNSPNMQLLQDLNKLSNFMEDPVKFCMEGGCSELKSPGNELSHTGLNIDVDESDLDLGSCSGRISPDKLVLKNIKRDSHIYPSEERRKSSLKLNANKLRLDLSKITNKKNY